MRIRGIAGMLACVLLLTSCTMTSSPDPSSSGDTDSGADVCPAGTSPQDGLCLSGDAVSEELAGILRSQFEAEKLTAVIAGVWHDGKPVMVGALGESMSGVPATPDMHHMLGNLTTPMLTTVVLQQVEAGVLSLDDPVSKWYPDLPSADAITVEMLLHNTSGYTQYTALDDFLEQLYADPFRQWEVDEIIQIGTQGGTVYTPGSDWMFSDTNSALLAGIVEKATAKEVSELLQTGVFDPLGMDETTATLDADWPQPVLHGFDAERGVWEDVTNWNPSWAQFAGGVGSNQDDVAVFLDALGSGELLSDEYHEIQLAPSTVGIGANTPEQYWAMGALMLDGWAFLNPGIPGYYGAGGTLSDEGWTVVVYTTPSPAADPSEATATDIFRQFTSIVSPDHSLEN
jgi:CubicO group peptidase (beta-lactamase class C family)